MKKKSFFFYLIISASLILSFIGCTNNVDKSKTVYYENNINRYLHLKISQEIFVELLQDSLWNKRDAYDASHILMIPLHYAFLKKDDVLIKAFENHFKRMLDAYKRDEVKLNNLAELQYLSLVSRYLALEYTSKDSNLEIELANLLSSRFLFYWIEEPAGQWDREPFEGGIKERIRWKLEEGDTRVSYYSVIHDIDFYIIGIAADLIRSRKIEPLVYEECIQAIILFERILNDRLDMKQEGWVLQKDMWLDHKDYAYSGYLVEPNQDSKKSVALSLQEDSSHSHRWPLWILQVCGVIDIIPIQNRLRWQLLNVVIDKNQKIGIPILNNYMCGHNGYYRWGYQTNSSSGYGPYQLSSTFGLGWWALLGGNDISNYYQQLANAFPLTEAQMYFYKIVTKREIHPLILNSYNNGIKQNIAIMASEVSRNISEFQSMNNVESLSYTKLFVFNQSCSK